MTGMIEQIIGIFIIGMIIIKNIGVNRHVNTG